MITGSALTELEKVQVADCLTEGIKNLNRILNKWISETKREGSHVKFSVFEVKGLAVGEIKRCLRNTLDNRSIDSIFKSTAIFIDADMVSGFVRSISFGEIDTWRHAYKISNQINAIFKSINYVNLKYNPSDYAFVGEIQVTSDQNFNPVITFDYGILNRIQF